MVAETKTAPAPATGGSNGFVTREMNGATFLTLEHIAHMALVVIVPGLLFTGVLSALSLWSGMPGLVSMMGMSGLLAMATTKALEAAMSLGVVAGLLVLVPALVVLDRRTRAEWHKRTGYASRLAYKIPVYIALALLAITLVSLVVEMLYVVLASLAYIGVQNAPIGSMYIDNFLPALMGVVIFGAPAWYTFKLAKGHDFGKQFSLASAVLGAAVVLSLFITTLVVMHNGSSVFDNSSSSSSGMMNWNDNSSNSNSSYQDLLNQLNR